MPRHAKRGRESSSSSFGLKLNVFSLGFEAQPYHTALFRRLFSMIFHAHGAQAIQASEPFSSLRRLAADRYLLDDDHHHHHHHHHSHRQLNLVTLQTRQLASERRLASIKPSLCNHSNLALSEYPCSCSHIPTKLFHRLNTVATKTRWRRPPIPSPTEMRWTPTLSPIRLYKAHSMTRLACTQAVKTM